MNPAFSAFSIPSLGKDLRTLITSSMTKSVQGLFACDIEPKTIKKIFYETIFNKDPFEAIPDLPKLKKDGMVYKHLSFLNKIFNDVSSSQLVGKDEALQKLVNEVVLPMSFTTTYKLCKEQLYFAQVLQPGLAPQVPQLPAASQAPPVSYEQFDPPPKRAHRSTQDQHTVAQFGPVTKIGIDDSKSAVPAEKPKKTSASAHKEISTRESQLSQSSKDKNAELSVGTADSKSAIPGQSQGSDAPRSRKHQPTVATVAQFGPVTKIGMADSKSAVPAEKPKKTSASADKEISTRESQLSKSSKDKNAESSVGTADSKSAIPGQTQGSDATGWGAVVPKRGIDGFMEALIKINTVKYSLDGVSATLIKQAQDDPKSLIKQFRKLNVLDESDLAPKKSKKDAERWSKDRKMSLVAVMVKTGKVKLVIKKIKKLGFSEKRVSEIAKLILLNLEALAFSLDDTETIIKLVECLKIKEDWDELYPTLTKGTSLLLASAIASTNRADQIFWRKCFDNDRNFTKKEKEDILGKFLNKSWETFLDAIDH